MTVIFVDYNCIAMEEMETARAATMEQPLLNLDLL